MFNNIISGNYIPQPDMLSRPENTVKQVQVYNRPVWINSNEIPTNRRNFANVPYNTVGSKLEGINTENFISHNTSTGQTQDNYHPSFADNVQVYSINETAFKIIYLLNLIVLLINHLNGVRHQKQIYWNNTFH